MDRWDEEDVQVEGIPPIRSKLSNNGQKGMLTKLRDRRKQLQPQLRESASSAASSNIDDDSIEFSQWVSTNKKPAHDNKLEKLDISSINDDQNNSSISSIDKSPLLEDSPQYKKQINFNSGHDKTALEGVYEILKLVELSQRKPNNNLIIVAGGGITERNIKRIVSESKVSEVFFFFFKFDIKLNFLISKNSHKVHLSGRSKIDSSMEYRNSNCSMGGMFGPSEYSLSFTNAQIIQKVHQQLQNK